jgi:hypothetical protein
MAFVLPGLRARRRRRPAPALLHAVELLTRGPNVAGAHRASDNATVKSTLDRGIGFEWMLDTSAIFPPFYYRSQ